MSYVGSESAKEAEFFTDSQLKSLVWSALLVTLIESLAGQLISRLNLKTQFTLLLLGVIFACSKRRTLPFH